MWMNRYHGFSISSDRDLQYYVFLGLFSRQNPSKSEKGTSRKVKDTSHKRKKLLCRSRKGPNMLPLTSNRTQQAFNRELWHCMVCDRSCQTAIVRTTCISCLKKWIFFCLNCNSPKGNSTKSGCKLLEVSPWTFLILNTSGLLVDNSSF